MSGSYQTNGPERSIEWTSTTGCKIHQQISNRRHHTLSGDDLLEPYDVKAASTVLRGLRHEVVLVFVMQKRSRHNPVFYHWYATRTCDQSNLMVRSFWDNGGLTFAGGP